MSDVTLNKQDMSRKKKHFNKRTILLFLTGLLLGAVLFTFIFSIGNSGIAGLFGTVADDQTVSSSYSPYSKATVTPALQLLESATVYNLFGEGCGYERPIGYEDYDVVGELRLFAYDFTKSNYQLCSGQELSGFRYSYLAKLYGSYQNYEMKAALPDLMSASPLSGINYYACTNAGLAAEASSSGNDKEGIEYFRHDNTAINGFYIGEIKLVANQTGTDINPAFEKNLILCDGRELEITDSTQQLFQRIGTTYGGDGINTFNVPDLTGKSPIEGATYYICLNGIIG